MPTETIGTVHNRNIIGMLKDSLESGSITQDDYDELMQLFFPGPKLVQGDLFDEKAKGGMATMDYMTRPVGYDNGGSVKEEHKTADIFGLHPLVVFQEMHDAYILDGGTLTFKEFFDAMQDQLNMEDLNEVPPVKEIG